MMFGGFLMDCFREPLQHYANCYKYYITFRNCALRNLCITLSESARLGLGWAARRKAQRYPAVSRAFATQQTAQNQDAPATIGLCRGSLTVKFQ
jgi:hypothetical protein